MANAEVRTLETASLAEVETPIEIEPHVGEKGPFFRDYASKTHAIQSQDGRHIITNRWASGQLNVIDTDDRRSWLVELGADVQIVGGITLPQAGPNREVLAVHAGSRVLTFRWQPTGRLDLIQEIASGGPPPTEVLTGPYWSIAWTEEGDRLIAANDALESEFTVIEVTDGGETMKVVGTIETCPTVSNLPNDIWTRNSVLPTYTPTPTPSVTPTPTATPPSTRTPTPSPTTTPPPTSTPTPTPSPSPTITRTPTATRTPAPIYLPILLREACTPDQQRTDVVLVVDASTSMLEPTAAGRTKLEAATEAAGLFLDQLHLDEGDQAAIVSFNATATLRTALVSDRPTLDAALASIAPASQTCLVCGVDLGATELTSPRRRADNTPLLILLTDGLSNPRPASEAVARADEAKAAGALIHTIGLGDTLDFEALEAMASEPAAFHRAPDGEDLADIYARIAVEIPCPPSRYWGRR